MSAPTKILIIRLSSLGDILHTLPAFQSLRATYPRARIDWLVEKRMCFLLSTVRGISRIHILDTAALRRRPASMAPWRNLIGLVQNLRASQYDLALDFQGLLKTAFLSLLSGARTRAGFSRDLVRERPAHLFYHRTVPRPESQMHITDLNRLLAQEAGARANSDAIDLQVSPEDEAEIRSRLQAGQLDQYVVINPGGGWPTKKWAPARYGSLASMIQLTLGLPVIVTTGPGEEMLYEEIARACPGAAPRHFPVSFLQLIPLLKGARLVVGGDTGPFHLACALMTPVVGIFGPTAPARNGPWSDMDESVVHVLPCSFCSGRTCPTQNECMEIEVEEVFAAVRRRLGHKP